MMQAVLRRAFAFSIVGLALAACGLDVVGSLAPDGGADGSTLGDGSVGPGSDDSSTSPGDGGVPNPDAGAAVLPSVVPGALLDPDAGDLTGLQAVDTTSLSVDIGAGLTTTLPAGVHFAVADAGASGVAVLSVGAMIVDHAVAVSGTRPLVILAAQKVSLSQVIDVSAKGLAPGPGGYGPGLGPGAGGNGKPQSGGSDNSGGGGGGHGALGASGGDTSTGVLGGTAGAMYSMPLVGGSGGGRGDPVACSNSGGAGGGALQVFSAVEIAVDSAGGIRAGGGGGAPGCEIDSSNVTSGAGGGAGGWVLLEAPRITVSGTVAANGGGGGGGASGGTGNGGPGENGVYGTRQADGGTGAIANREGGRGGSVLGPAQKAPIGTNCGAGGGAVGRIVFHTRGDAIFLDGGTVSPPATHDGGL